MHDCASTNDRIVELLVGELDEAERQSIIGEIAECGQCACAHGHAAAALAALDDAVASRMPDESYWPGYAATLRARLETEQAPKRGGRVWLAAAGLKVMRSPGAYLAAACLLLSLGLGLLLYSRDGSPVGIADGESVSTLEAPKPQAQAPSSREPLAQPLDKAGADGKGREAIARGRARHVRKARAVEVAPLEVRIAEHVESIELLLRSFRNARAAGGESAPDVSFERALARKMIGQNNRLRSEAIASGDLSVEDLLGSAEPFLLEIANLPENPSEGQTQTIRRLLKENGIISELRLYSVALKPDHNP